MAEVINMPRLSDTMEEGTVAKWHKQVGDSVEEGDILAEIETDKATLDFESFHEGTLLHIGVQEGETTAVDKLLAIIGEKGEDIKALIDGQAKPTMEAKKEMDSSSASTMQPKSMDMKHDEKSNAAEKPTSASVATKIPDNVTVVTMPRLSDTMEEGTVARWNKKVGDAVQEGDILAEIETDKATLDFESFHEGTLLHIGVKEGESTKVDALLAIIGPEGTDVTNIAENYKSSGNATAEQAAPSAPEMNSSKEDDGNSHSMAEHTHTNGMASTTEDGRVFASPLAKRIASDKNIDLNSVKGSGENGRIVKRDIENYKPEQQSHSEMQSNAMAKQDNSPKAMANAPVAAVVSGEENHEDIKHSQVRKVIARRLSESKFTAPHYYLSVEFNMDNAIAVRKQINELPNTKVSYNDMIIKACALTLRRFPQVNSSWHDDFARLNHHVHIGVAVAVDQGLVVPVVRFANELSLQQIANSVQDLATKAQDRKLAPNDMSGSTFTISNLGKFGIESFTSIINQPNAAILSVGAIVQKPIVKDNQIVVGHTMKLTMACDHRVVDGAVGAEFLQSLKNYIENPATMLA